MLAQIQPFTVQSISQCTSLTEISKCIDCNLMDTINISNIINQFIQLTPLQLAWKRFCTEENLMDTSDFSDFRILDHIKDTYPKNNNLYQYGKTYEFIDYCDDSLLKLLINELLNSIDFKFFNASLLYSCGEVDYDFHSEFMEDRLIHAEEEYDNYEYNEENLSDYFYAVAQSNKIKFIRYCLQRLNNREIRLPELKKTFDSFFYSLSNKDKEDSKCKLCTKIYERIWQRAIDYDSFDPWADEESESESENIDEVELI